MIRSFRHEPGHGHQLAIMLAAWRDGPSTVMGMVDAITALEDEIAQMNEARRFPPEAAQ